MAAKFKVGDRVRRSELHAEGTVIDVHNMFGVDFAEIDYGVWGTWKFKANELEPVPVAEATGTDAQADKPKFKVGDRVRYGDFVCAGTGVVAGVNDDDSWFIKVEDQHRKHCPFDDGTTRLFGADNLEPVAADQQPQPLRIQAGKFYRTRDGCKVGPMYEDDCGDGYPWTANNGGYYDAYGVRQSSIERGGGTLIAEWVDEPANDNSTAGFTVPLCELEAEPDLTAIGKAYADGYAAGLAARQAA